MKRGDVIIILVILATLLVVVGITSIYQKKEAKFAEIRIDGKIIERLDLNINIEKRYDTEFGHNLVVVSDGDVHVNEADCLDQICVETKKASKAGQSIVCVPNRFSVEIIGGEGDVDAIAR